MKADPEQAADAANVVPIMAALDGKFGTMSSVSGGSLIKYSKNKLAAIALLQFLSSPIAQKMYTDLNHEMSVRPDVADARFKDIDTRSVAGNVTYRGPALHLIEQIAG
jgi:ABC-type Fe3+ transport system substrate-binding protein